MRQQRYRVAEGSPSVPAKGGSAKAYHRTLFYQALENKDPLGALEILEGKGCVRRVAYSRAEASEFLLDLSCVVINALCTIPKEERNLWCVAGSVVQHTRRLLARNVVLHDAVSQALAGVRH